MLQFTINKDGGRKMTPKKKRGETESHKRLKNKLKKIMERCNFKVDREVHLNVTGKKDREGRYEDDVSIDVLAMFSYKGNKCAIVFECKDVGRVRNLKKLCSAWERNITKILDKQGTIKVISSSDRKISDGDFKQIDKIKLCWVFSDKLIQKKYESHQDILNQYSFVGWDFRALKYYDKISAVLEAWTKYEIFREFGFFFEATTIHKAKAVKIKQSGRQEMYILGLHPGLLLKICYVRRRTSTKPEAYQRMLNKDRIEQISKFLSSNKVLLPNAIIITFDNEERVQKEIEYDGTYLKFPIIYCSAWIIDGQHRVFGFLNTKYGEWDEERSEEFRLPVVAFRNLDEIIQNKTFVNINYHQKKINPTLLCDLATATLDIKNELTWPSLLVKELNGIMPLKDFVKVSEFDTGKPITLSSFARYGLLESLLGFNKKKAEYKGPLYHYAPFDPSLEFRDEKNQKSFKKQLNLLKNFFKAVENNTKSTDKDKDPWSNLKDYSLLKTTGINALLLVLTRIIEKYPKMNINLDTYLAPLRKIDFGREYVATKGGGWRGFRSLANEILEALNTRNQDNLRLFGETEKL